MTSPGQWEFPGGKVEAGESDEVALARELREELSIGVRVGEWVTDVLIPRSARSLRLVFYACELVEGEPVLSEHDALRWLGPHELDALSWQAADRPALEPVRRLMQRG